MVTIGSDNILRIGFTILSKLITLMESELTLSLKLANPSGLNMDKQLVCSRWGKPSMEIQHMLEDTKVQSQLCSIILCTSQLEMYSKMDRMLFLLEIGITKRKIDSRICMHWVSLLIIMITPDS